MARNHVGEGVGATFDLAANFPERTGRRKHTIAHIVRIGRYPVGEAPVVEVVKQLQKERGGKGELRISSRPPSLWDIGDLRCVVDSAGPEEGRTKFKCDRGYGALVQELLCSLQR